MSKGDCSHCDKAKAVFCDACCIEFIEEDIAEAKEQERRRIADALELMGFTVEITDKCVSLLPKPKEARKNEI